MVRWKLTSTIFGLFFITSFATACKLGRQQTTRAKKEALSTTATATATATWSISTISVLGSMNISCINFV
ncbi:hypothetical protein VNO80_14828 [Phaseolus coccineus]|uniref:Uncharacterized protein n=1 Tax=Phaseolus coccineus TaxID=3886 RepID=A0AAN9MQ61_PHACN